MQINILGCSGGIGEGLQTTALRVRHNTLIDCGTGVGSLPIEDLRQIEHVFLTHSHLDHIAGLPLLVDTIYAELQNRPLYIHCQEETYQAIAQHIFNWKIWPNFFELPNAENPVIRFVPMRPGEVRSIEDLNIRMIEVLHTVPAVAYYLQDSTASFAFSGDTGPSPLLWEALNELDQLDLLLVECSFPDELDDIALAAQHYSPSTLAKDLQILRHQPTLCVSHLQPGNEKRILDQLDQRLDDLTIQQVSSGDILSL